MTDKNDAVVDEPVADIEPTEEPKAEEAQAEEPKAVGGVAEPAGTDQQGRQLYDVKCANCGKQTQVPFKPTGDRPVYCRDCYMQKKGARG